MLPVVGLGVIGSEHDDDDIGSGGLGALEVGGLLVRLVAAVHEGSTAEAKVFHLPFFAEHLLQLRGPGLPALGADALGDAVANTGHFNGVIEFGGIDWAGVLGLGEPEGEAGGEEKNGFH